jgi:predicted nucleic acid-binding protein
MSGCVLDTDILIAALDRQDAHHTQAANAIKAMIKDGTPLLLSLINYAETLVRPAEAEDSLATATNALGALKLKLIAPTPAIALDAARHRSLRSLNISLADAFALATAQAHHATVATFDHRVRRALPKVGLELTARLAAQEDADTQGR